MNINTVNNVLAGLSKFQIDMYASREDTDFMMLNYIQNNLKLNVQSGQKRLVVDSTENDTKVWKIATSYQALKDNIHEALISASLDSKVKEGKVTPEERQLFVSVRIRDWNPFIIEADKGIRFTDCPEFTTWCNEVGLRRHPDFNDAQLFKIWISSVESLRNDFNTIQKRLKEYVASDSAMKEPANFCIWYDNNKNLRLKLIDMGSILPIFIDGKSGRVIRPKCPSCGSEMEYVNVEIQGEITGDTELEGFYGCYNAQCQFAYQTVATSMLIREENSDLMVYKRYWTQDAREQVRFIYVIFGCQYQPVRVCETQSDYNNEIYMNFGEKVYQGLKSEQLNAMYKNYTLYMIAENQNQYPEMDNVIASAKEEPLSYSDFFQVAIEDANIDTTTFNTFTRKFIAYSYINSLMEIDDLVDLRALLGSNSLNEFASAIQSLREYFPAETNLLTDTDVELLFNDLSII